MVWAPNIALNYPFRNATEAYNAASPENRLVLDTSGNEKLDVYDDPYEPFYPGDANVDWVGITLNFYNRPEKLNQVPPPQYFSSALNADLAFLNEYGFENKNVKSLNFTKFALDHGKPIIIW